MSGNEALLFLGDVRNHLTLVALTEQEYFQVADASAEAGLAGGVIYDAILGRCALKAKAEVIYTWNVKDFMRLGSGIASRVSTPS